MTEEPFHFSHAGWCPVCEKETAFHAERPQFRDHLKCKYCGSIPRQRALVHVMSQFFPKWRDATIHEAGPAPWLSICQKLRRECKAYVESQYVPNQPLGEKLPKGKWDPPSGVMNQDLQRQTFRDAQFDIVITQDVFEHVFEPASAIREIARTLKPGGAHICTVPITQKHRPSRRRASIINGEIVHHQPPEYHGNPVATEGSLVTIDWGYDIAAYLSTASGLSITIVNVDNIDLGIRAELIEVLVCQKITMPSL